MGLITNLSRIWEIFKGEPKEAKAARQRIAFRKAAEKDDLYGADFDGDNKDILSAAHKALFQAPLPSLDHSPDVNPLVEDMTEELWTPWEAYGIWYFWEPGDSDNPLDIKSAGPFDTKEMALLAAKSRKEALISGE